MLRESAGARFLEHIWALGLRAARARVASKSVSPHFCHILERYFLAKSAVHSGAGRDLSTPGELSLPQMAAEDSRIQGCSLLRNRL